VPPPAEDDGLLDAELSEVTSSAGAASAEAQEPPESEDEAADITKATETASAAPAAAAEPAEALPGAPLPADCTFETTSSGLKYAVVAKGSDGSGCLSTDMVTLQYTGYLLDGTRFDGTEAGQPATFPVHITIQGFQEALSVMTPGTRLKVVIPSKLAYGKTGFPGAIPPDADLVFDMELIAVAPGPAPKPAPQSLPSPAFELPAAEELSTTASGLQHKVVTAGAGRSPGPTETVTVHYAGWLTDGTPFDNSYERGETTSFPLNGVIKGWTEGLQLMQEGGTSIFVIPSDLAYGPGGAGGGLIPPNATLVFRVELVSIDG
jgi:FKBP-type peptidyl-prolyl cis-trans isomerase